MTLLDEIGTLVDGYAETIDVVEPSGGARAARIRIAVEALADGRAVVLCDDAVDPTRGEVVFAAAAATAALVAFAVRRGSGFLQVALPDTRCDQLGLTSQCGADRGGLQLCVTVDVKNSNGTGISASDRSSTVRLLASPHSTAESFTRPGHVVPVRAEMYLAPEYFGFAEAAVWMTTAAGAGAAAVLTTVIGVADPTGIASGRDLLQFCREHQLPMVSVGDLVAEQPVSVTLDQHLRVGGQSARLLAFDDDGVRYLCLFLGDATGHTDVPLDLTSANGILDGPVVERRGPRIRLAMGDGHHRRSGAHLHRRLHDSQSAVWRVFRSAGINSVQLTNTSET